jgi:hypothetical protein
VLRIRIQEGKNDPQKYKKVQQFHVSSAGCSLLGDEGFSCSLGILYGGLGISNSQFFSKKGKFFLITVNVFQLLVIKTLDSDWIWFRIGNKPRMLHPDSE